MPRTISETESRSVEKGERRTMKISKKELNRKKAKAMFILEAQGLSHDDWLAQKYKGLFRKINITKQFLFGQIWERQQELRS